MSFLANIGSMFAQPAVQAIAAGLLSGAVIGSTVVASGILAPEPEQPKLVALVACPGGGPELARVPPGQQLLITGRSEDGTWLEVFIGEPGTPFAWAPAPAVRASAALDALPIRKCDTSMTFLPTLGPPEPTVIPPTAVPATVLPSVSLPPGVTASPAPPATPTPRPSASPTPTPKPTPTKPPTAPPTAVPTPTPTPTPAPTPTPTPTPPPDLTPPSITNVNIAGAYTNGDGNYWVYHAGSPCGFPSATISVNVSDTGGSGLAGFTVRLHWVVPGGSANSQQMSYSLATGRYTYTLNPSAAWADGYIEYWVTASDNAGNAGTTTHPPDNAHWLFKASSCVT